MADLKTLQLEGAPSAAPLRSLAPTSVEQEPGLVARGAADMPSPAAARSITLARDAGVAPDYVAADLPGSEKAAAERDFAEGLRGRPALETFARQSAQHAAAIREDIGPLGKLEGWFTDLGDAFKTGVLDMYHAEAMREYMGSGGPAADTAVNAEAAVEDYDKVQHTIPQDIARAAPQMFVYGVTGRVSGTAGVAGLMYAQNKGVLARQIKLAQIHTQSPEQMDLNYGPEVQVVGKDGRVQWRRMGPEMPVGRDLTDDEIDAIASAGSSVGAVLVAGLLGPILRSMPGARSALQQSVASVLARTAATTPGKIALRALLAYGQHTFMGALGMTLQSAINSETVNQAMGKNADIEQIARQSAETFVKVLPVAAAFAAYGPGKEYLEDRARINGSVAEAAKLNDMVKWAQEAKLTKHSPGLARELFGEMSGLLTVYIDHEAASRIPGLDPAAVADAQVSKGSVAVPLADYLAHFHAVHEGIREDVKLTPDGMTIREAGKRDKEMRLALTPGEARALYGRLPVDELLPGVNMPLAGDMKPGFAKNLGDAIGFTPPGMTPEIGGRSGNTADVIPRTDAVKVPAAKTANIRVGTAEANKAGNTAVTPPLHEVMATEYGGKAEEWAERLTPELMQALNEEGTVGAISPEEHAARVIEALPVGAIDPKQYERLAKKSTDFIQEQAEKGVTGMAAGGFGINSGTAPQLVQDVAILHSHELARDVNLAKAKKAREVQAEMEKAQEKLSSQAANDELRAKMRLAGAPILRLFDALAEGSGAAKTRRGWAEAHDEAVKFGLEPFSPEATEKADQWTARPVEEALQWFNNTARPYKFDVDALRDFLSKQRTWGDMRPAELRNALDAVDQLVAAAKWESKVRAADAEATVREVQEQASAELAQNPSKGLPKMSGIKLTAGEAMARDANAANAVMLRYKNNLRQKSETLVKWLYDRINDGVYIRDELYRTFGEQFRRAFDEMPKEVAARRKETYDISDKLPTPGMEPLTKVDRTWLWKLAQHRMSSGNMDRVISTEGWSKAVIDGILFDDPHTKLTVPEWDYLQRQADIGESIWGKLKEHLETYYGMAPPKVAGVPFKVRLEDGTYKEYAGGYHPLKRDRRLGVAVQEPTGGIAQFWGGADLPSMPGAVKDRVENSQYRVNMDWDSGRANVAQVLHWLALDQPVRDVGKLLNDQRLTQDMNQYMGEGRTQVIHDWLKTVATQQTQSIPESSAIVAKAFGANRKLALMGIIGGSLRLGLMQAEHPFGLMFGNEVNPLHGLPALLSIFKPFTTASGEVQLMPNWNMAIEHGRQVQRRADNAFNTLRESFDKVQEPTGPLGSLKDLAVKTAGLYLHAVDRLTTTWAWTAFHNEAVAKGMEPLSKEAIAYADGKTEDVMPVHNLESAAPILTNKQLGGFLIMHGFKNTLYNMRQDALAKSVKEFHLAEGPAETSMAALKTAGRIGLNMAMMGGFAVMAKVVSGYGQQPDETKDQFIGRTFLGGQAEDIPFIGGLMEPAAKVLSGIPARMRGDSYSQLSKHDFTVFGNPGLALMTKTYETLGRVVNENREGYKTVFDLAELAMFGMGVPSRPLRVSAENLYKVLTGEEYDSVDGPADKIGKFFYTEKQWESLRRTLSPDEVF